MKRWTAAPLLALLLVGWIAVQGPGEESEATTLEDMVTPIEVRITEDGILTEVGQERPEFVRGSLGDLRVINESDQPRNFVVGVDSTEVLAPGDRTRLEIHFPLRGSTPYRVTVNRAPGLTGRFRVF